MNKERLSSIIKIFKKAQDTTYKGEIINLNPNESLIIRSSPDYNSGSLGKLKNGDDIEVLGDKRQFDSYLYFKVRARGITGWVEQSFIRYHDDNNSILFSGTRTQTRGPNKAKGNADRLNRGIRSPISGSRITSGYGMRMHPIKRTRMMHRGVDISAPEGTPVVAPESGIIKAIRPNNDGAGNTIYLEGGEGRIWIFMHLSSFSVNTGDAVQAGQELAKSGKTGRATGPHLHFELKINGQHVDPMNYIA